MNTNRQTGFTLIELMITVAIVGILAIVAVPSMSSFIKNERLTTQINSLFSHLQYARSEAILRHKQVILCASSDGASCSGGNWTDGWMVFYDEDLDGSFSGADVILKVRDKLKGNNTLGSTGGASIIYDYRGFTPNTAAVFGLCDDRGSDYGKAITISLTGRVRTIKGAVTCP